MSAMCAVISVPALNSMASSSIPSENATPLAGILETTLKSSPLSILPQIRSACVVRYDVGNITLHTDALEIGSEILLDICQDYLL